MFIRIGDIIMRLLLLILGAVIYFYPSLEIRLLIINVISIFWLISFLIYSFYIYYFHDREYKTSKIDRGDGSIPSKRTPVELNYLYSGNISYNCLTATIMDFIRRKVLIVEKKGKNYIINYNEERGNILTRSEQFLIHWFMKRVGYKNYVSLTGIIREANVDYNYFCLSYKEWMSRAMIEGLKESFFEKKEAISQDAYAFIGIGLVVIILNIFLNPNMLLIGIMFITVIIFCAYIYSYSKRTNEANKEYVKWKTFKKFLNNYDKYKNQNDVAYLEDCAIYANVLNNLSSYRKLLRRKYKDNPTLLQSSDLLKMIIDNDIIIINKKIKKCIKWCNIKGTTFNN